MRKEFLYDNGFGDRYYICTNCKSHRLKQNIKGGFSPPDYTCTDCGETVYSPMWKSVDEVLKAKLKKL